MNSQQIIQTLGLEPHIEGGYFRRTFQSSHQTQGSHRPVMTAIYYLLTEDSPIGHLHRNRSDILHFHQAGAALTYYLVSPSGVLSRRVLGPDLAQGQQLQLLVPGGWWKGTVLESGAWGLLSEAVAPGFDYADMTLASKETVLAEFPGLWPELARLVRGWDCAVKQA